MAKGKRSHICSIMLICIGLSTAGFMGGIMMNSIGFGIVLKIGLQIALKIIPLNEEFMAWISIPLLMIVEAKITEADAIYPFENKVGGGDLKLSLKFSSWLEEEEDGDVEEIKKSEMVHIQRSSEIDEIQYYRMVLSTSIFNWASLISWILICFGTFLIGIGVALKLKDIQTEMKNRKVAQVEVEND